MEECVYLTRKEYDNLVERAERQNIPVDYEIDDLRTKDGSVKCVHEIRINMRELKLQICKQYDINPDETIHFY